MTTRSARRFFANRVISRDGVPPTRNVVARTPLALAFFASVARCLVAHLRACSSSSCHVSGPTYWSGPTGRNGASTWTIDSRAWARFAVLTAAANALREAFEKSDAKRMRRIVTAPASDGCNSRAGELTEYRQC